MTIRRHLTPSPESHGLRSMRRSGGTRREVTERVTLRGPDGDVHEGWALNISRGGVRVILESKVELGAEFDVTVGEEEPTLAQRGRIVWLQEETDGVIAGVEFVGGSGLHRSAPPPPPDPADTSAETAPREAGTDGGSDGGAEP